MHRHSHRPAVDGKQQIVDRGALLTEPDEQLRAIASIDKQSEIRREPTPDIPPFNASLVVLTVDDPDAARRNRKVIDVCSRSGPLTIVEHTDAPTRQTVQSRAKTPLAMSTLAPRSNRLRLLAHRKNQSTEALVSRADLRLVRTATLIGFMLRGGACRRTGRWEVVLH